MGKRKKPVVWAEPLVGSQRYKLIFTSEDVFPDLKGLEGATVYTDSIIAIADHLSDERADDVLSHEIFVHALMENSGVSEQMRERLGLTVKQWQKIEEELALTYGPALMGFLKSNGWLNLPAKPKRTTIPAVARIPVAAKRSRRSSHKHR